MLKLIILIVIILLGVGVWQYLSVQKSQDNNNPPIVNQVVAPLTNSVKQTSPQTSFWFEPNPATVDSEGQVTLDAFIDTKENSVTAVQLEVSYDPKVLKFVSIKGTDLLGGKPELIKKVDESAGRITFASGITPGQDVPIQGKDEFAQLVFKSLSSGAKQTEVKILSESRASAEDTDQSVVSETQGATVNLK